jgi:hypothetical protein
VLVVIKLNFLHCLCLQETSSYKIAARPERRRQFESDLSSSANVAINLLTACMTIDELKEQVKPSLQHFFIPSL